MAITNDDITTTLDADEALLLGGDTDGGDTDGGDTDGGDTDGTDGGDTDGTDS